MDRDGYHKLAYDFGVAMFSYVYCPVNQQTVSLVEDILKLFSDVLYYRYKKAARVEDDLFSATFVPLYLYETKVHDDVLETVLSFFNDSNVGIKQFLADYAHSKEVKDYFML